MEISELLKKYRMAQKKSQQEWSGDIISRSFYAKVERGVHRISFEDLLNLLNFNHISVIEFINKLSSDNYPSNEKEKHLYHYIINSYYQKSETNLINAKEQVANSNLFNKKELLILINSLIALVNNNFDKIDKASKVEIETTLFNIENFNEFNLKLYCDCMHFYPLQTNLIISKNIVQKFLKIEKLQISVLGIISNILGLCIEHNYYSETDFFIDSAAQITTRPELFFYKNMIEFFKSMIAYHYDHKKYHLEYCFWVIKTIKTNGMPEYAEDLKKYLYQNCQPLKKEIESRKKSHS
ncbi:XRE family transcriptional regulator [Lactobacillus sp. ESL0731]|uniref:helix-turn-helix domain-containing protein n=1 Tax=unclassified Lactobacillus TaxID=2620435 RepID=UPI0023F6E6CD|nr:MULTISPECIES: Rgg/GadR/MutR family transcriptional regulator [unclassified Lactobacillus]WEV51778.1 XRE family transcriptional regulator [Lactobacillus sp. ESL0700]WEV62907.1 XRE family transcriptional regulator [Lactobacillus sp. ESL0731]